MIQAETLSLLEWNRLCHHLSTFAETSLGVVAAQQLLPPETEAESRTLLNQTQEVERIEASLNSNWKFNGIADITEALERAELGGLLSGPELLAIATTLAGVRRLRRVIEGQEDLPCLMALVEDVRTYPELEQEIHHCIDEAGKVADRASAKLAGIRQKLKDIRDQIYQKLHRLLQRQLSAVQEAVITQRDDRFVIPIKASHKEQIPGIIHDTSSSGATLYVEPQAIVDLGNKLRQARRQEQVEEEIVLRQLSDRVGACLEDLEHLLIVATRLDLATARLRYSLWLEGNPPQWVTREQAITLRQLRHPLLVWKQKREKGPEVVPITVQIDPKIRVIAITGPNTGGKTVTLKTLGLAMLMAKVGLYLPAKEPIEIPWLEQILADIGDEQSLEQSLSTFSGHIRRIIRIIAALKQSPEGLTSALVLLDEVGAGTDPVEGSALAIALLQYLADHAHLTLVSTHYGELKALKYQDERFENASVEFDDQTLSPTYRLLWGIPGRSNALTIAQRLGLHPEIVETAKQRLGGFSEEINQVIAGLESQRREQEAKASNAQKLLQQTEVFYQEVSRKATALQARERELKQYQEQEIQQAILAAKAEIAQVIRQLQRGKPSGQKAQQATEALNQIVAKEQAKTQAKPLGYLPKVGERVRLPSLGQTAEVTQLSEAAGEVSVKFGLMKMTLPLTEIESLDGKKVEPPPKPASPPPPPVKAAPVLVRTERNTIDLRGQRVEMAESQLEAALRRADDQGVLWIIHGKGTGKLREGVHAFLSHHPQVERFELASSEEGGAGVTLAYLQ
ncbi:endonuclease MutS2 [Synechocystis sp. LKSZ1]|uniref:endonuclease MutS2 n=1 Tax=Synechocystis sp. LKSZ1 TaxID=3144951 RepID=UPI00336BCE53